MTDLPSLSVVVIGRNEGARLTRCLESVLAMDVPPGGSVETVYVDSASTDDSVKRARQLGAKVIEVNPARPCASAGRNAGWRAALAPVVLFLDGDTILQPDFVRRAWQLFDDAKAGVVFGDRREIDTAGSIYNRVLDLDWLTPPGEVELCGGDALIRRGVLECVNGYDENLIAGEDAELCSRIRAAGFNIVHIDRPMTGHDLAIHGFSQYWRRSLRTGYAYAEVSARLRGTPLPIWSREARRNLVRGSLMTAVVAGAPILSLAIHSIIPAVIMIAIVLMLAARTAHRSKWRCADFGTRLLYGLHSQLGHIPILFGQLKYYRNRLSGRSERLIEYKGAMAPHHPEAGHGRR
jgi:cellulose synthase/poly-beta-1,6-N-acetylglucosamine synthase-like glycosyltransferase